METLDKQKFDTLKELSDLNIKISDAKNTLLELEQKETKYLEDREKKTLVKINKILVESSDLLTQTHQNYEKIHQFCSVVSNYADFLEEAHQKFSKMLETFGKRNEQWEDNYRELTAELSRQRKIVEQDEKTLKEREKRIDEATESLKKERTHLESQQETLKVAYEHEQKLWNKIQQTN
jgi:chromosome segregation ATPase